jgi:hypothetical protein
MRNSLQDGATPKSADIVDFDEAMLDACTPELRADLLAEAALLAQAFAPERDPARLTAMAEALCRGEPHSGVDRGHARRLAAALRRLAHQDAA